MPKRILRQFLFHGHHETRPCGKSSPIFFSLPLLDLLFTFSPFDATMASTCKNKTSKEPIL